MGSVARTRASYTLLNEWSLLHSGKEVVVFALPCLTFINNEGLHSHTLPEVAFYILPTW